MKPTVSIVILTWNRATYLDLCLTSLLSSLTPECRLSHEVIVMDNGSTDSTKEVLAKHERSKIVRVVRNVKNLGLNAYKRLFVMARGKYIIEVDDDVIQFPSQFDAAMVDYLEAYRDYGYLSLNVIQNEMTNGAKLPPENYTDDIRGKRVIEEGPAGGWCAIFRRIHCFFLIPLLYFYNIRMKMPEDALLQSYFMRIHKRFGIIKHVSCLHANGVQYAKKFGNMRRENEKYIIGDLPELAAKFES